MYLVAEPYSHFEIRRAFKYTFRSPDKVNDQLIYDLHPLQVNPQHNR